MKTRSWSSPPDRLSELSDSLILHILGFLPMMDLVRTTILSKRWKNVWTTVPFLNFVYDEEINAESFVNGAVNSWRGTDIKKLNVESRSKFDKSSMASSIDSLLGFASRNKVEELSLSFPVPDPCSTVSESKNIYPVPPQCLYSCLLLKCLTLEMCDLRIRGNVRWHQLKKLTIHGEGVRESSINRVLRGSPQLEELHLTTLRGSDGENLSIRFSSLKWLHIGVILPHSSKKAPWVDSKLRISTPNLKMLHLLGVPYGKCVLMDVSSLNKVFLTFDNSPSYGKDIGEKAGDIFPTFELVQEVTLSDWSIKALGAMKEKHKLSPFPNANYLELRVSSSQVYEQIVGVLEIFPNLKNLVVETTCKSTPPLWKEGWPMFERNFSDSFLLQLRTVHVSWTKDDNSIFLLIRILLKHASKLEKLVFRENRSKPRTPWKSLYMASEKLLKMQRSSPNAELILF